MADFPTNVPTNGSLFIATNNASSTLNGGVTNVATSFTCASTALFSASGKASIESEIIYFGANDTATSVLSSITRASEGTTAASHANGTTINMYMTAAHHNATKDEVIAIAQWLKDKFGLDTGHTILPAGKTIIFQPTAGVYYALWIDSNGTIQTQPATVT